jgi:hypothetical protein
MLKTIEDNGGLIAYSDATWHRGNELGHNSYGYVIYLFGAPIAYAAKNLKVIALSSAEAEYAAASHTCREVQFIRHVLMQLGFDLSGPTIMGVDNTAAITICKNRGVTPKSKHFDVATHKVRDCYQRRIVHPTFVSTLSQRADGFTKPLDKTKFKAWLSTILSDKTDSDALPNA